MQWDEIKFALWELKRGYPVEAAEAVLADPLMIDRMAEEFARIAKEPDELEVSMFHLHAMNLLAQVRDTRAFRPLLEIAALPSEQLEDALGDHLTESLDRCVASVCDDEELIRSFIEDHGYDMWARVVMVDALVKRVLEGDSPVEPLINWLVDLGNRTVAWIDAQGDDSEKTEGDLELMNAIAGALGDVGGPAEMDHIQRWWDGGWLNPQHADLDWYQREIWIPWEERVNELHRSKRGYVRDAISDMRKWYCFSDKFHDELERKAHKDSVLFHDSEIDGTYEREGQKIGRNDPCPCGSGKKYKKCCGK